MMRTKSFCPGSGQNSDKTGQKVFLTRENGSKQPFLPDNYQTNLDKGLDGHLISLRDVRFVQSVCFY